MSKQTPVTDSNQPHPTQDARAKSHGKSDPRLKSLTPEQERVFLSGLERFDALYRKLAE